MLISLAFSAGCASRAIPFDQLDKAQITIYKIQAPAPVAVISPLGTAPPNPCMLVPLPPELQAMCLQAAQVLPTLLPGLIPGLPAPTANPTPLAPPPMLFRAQWQIVDQRPIMDEATRKQLLDTLGAAESFTPRQSQCFTPGMAISFQSPNFIEPVDVVVSFSCGIANGFGFAWPHGTDYGLQPQSGQALSSIYQSLFGPLPPSGV
ncbi:MAG: hypothetical protein EXR75_07300 [Myxococcales bacterium]|nr:hypothetical protein [Myxococcales bacterium]